MKEGAWINALTGDYCWIVEHATWIQTPENAQCLGLPDDVQSRLATIPWDFNGKGRRAILHEAMGAGFIRVRGHGVITTFESRLPLEQAVLAAAPFMAEHFGPLMACRFNNLDTEASWAERYEVIAEAIKANNLGQLLEGAS